MLNVQVWNPEDRKITPVYGTEGWRGPQTSEVSKTSEVSLSQRSF